MMVLLFGGSTASGQDIENAHSSDIPEEKTESDIPEWYPDLTRSEDYDESHGDPKNQFIRIQDDTFERQNLLTGKPIEDTDSAVGAIYAYAGIGFIALIVGFLVVKKINNRNKIDSRKLKKSRRNFQHKKRS